MIKGLALTPPVVGRISIGRIIEQNGKRLPQKDDQFTLTTQVQHKDGWLLHPLDQQLREAQPNQQGAANRQPPKLQKIPVRLLFDQPDLNFRAEYSLFDRKTGRPLCVGNGSQCRRLTQEGLQQLDCPSPTWCEFGKGGLCKPYGRLNVLVAPESQNSNDELGSFIFRSTGFNSIRTLAARLNYYQAVSGHRLSCLDLQLKIRGKSTTLSHRTPIFYVDLTLPDGLDLATAIQQAIERQNQRQAAGWDQQALDQAAQKGFANAWQEDTEDDLPEILEHFYPEATEAMETEVSTVKEPTRAGHQAQSTHTLKQRLQRPTQQ